ncbi:hypothetical protein HRbin20_01402 [bacterium HR20]|nr:hypothetical protein HRbin20_01402 [bacterium HR20]
MHRTRWAGIALIIVGIVLLLETLGVIPSIGWVLEWWPVLLIAAGIRIVLRKPESLASGLVVIAIGCLLLADNIFPGFDFWVAAVPVFLIVLGIGILTRPLRDNATGRAASIAFARNNQTLDSELINVVALFGGAGHVVTSQHFRGGSIQAVFGGVELDLSRARMAATEASLDVEAFFGGVKIRVPPTWAVAVEGAPIFGGIDNKTMSSTTAEELPLLRIRATVVFGGIEIR